MTKEELRKQIETLRKECGVSTNVLQLPAEGDLKTKN